VSGKKILGWLAVAFLVWYVVKSPAAAAGTWHSATGFITSGFQSLGTFVSKASH
jgi:hypothetical protein